MTAGQKTRRVTDGSMAPAPLAALLAMTLLGGAILGTVITLQFGSNDATVAAAAPIVEQPAVDVQPAACALGTERTVHPGQP